MVISATHFKDVTNGYERTTDGLWVHRGKFSAGPPSADVPYQSGDINANRGNGTGVYYFASKPNQFIYFDGTNFVFSPPLQAGALAAGSVQAHLGEYVGIPAFTSTLVAPWVLTPVAAPITTSGGRLRIEFSLLLTHTAANAVVGVAVGWDGAAVQMLSTGVLPVPTQGVALQGTGYYTLAVGAHTVQMFLYNQTAGTVGFYGAGYSTLFVTEEKR